MAIIEEESMDTIAKVKDYFSLMEEFAIVSQTEQVLLAGSSYFCVPTFKCTRLLS